MSISKIHVTERPYDKGDIDSILRYASRLTGRTLREIFDRDSGIIGGTNSKGYFGQIIESDYFYIDNNSDPMPDFREAGIELKVTPLKESEKGLVSKERLVLGIIDYMDVPDKGFDIFLKKNSHILLIFYLWKKDSDIYDYRIKKVIDWVPSQEEMHMIKDDWGIIQRFVERGEADLLSERHTKILAACTKGAGHGKDMRRQPFSDKLAKQRALSFKPSFMTMLYETHTDVGELMIDRANEYGSIFDSEWPENISFDDYVLGHFNRFKGRTCTEIERMLSIDDLNDSTKQYYSTLVMAMMGIRHKRHVKEFEESNISIKSVRINNKGMPKESMSFPAFKFEEIAEQTWETSELFVQMDHCLFIPVFQSHMSDIKDEPKKDLVFRGAFFWSMPNEDFRIVEKVWEDTKEKVLQERFDDFIRASDEMIAHVRPHGRDSNDTYPYRGIEHPKKSFWLNSGYIKRIIQENLDKDNH